MQLDATISRDVESSEFKWQLGLTGSRARAMQMLVNAPQAVALLNALKDNEGAAYDVADRVLHLAYHPDDDPQYTHPFDAAIAAYLRALGLLYPDLAFFIGLHVNERCENLWWAVPVVERILQTRLSTEVLYLLDDGSPQDADVPSSSETNNNVVSVFSSGARRLSRASMKIAASMAVGTTLCMSEEPSPTMTIDQASHVYAIEEVVI